MIDISKMFQTNADKLFFQSLKLQNKALLSLLIFTANSLMCCRILDGNFLIKLDSTVCNANMFSSKVEPIECI